MTRRGASQAIMTSLSDVASAPSINPTRETSMIASTHAYDLSHSAVAATNELDMTVLELPSAVLAGSFGSASSLSTIGGTAFTASTSGCGGGAAEDLAF
jgi:hypothetical protein